MVTLARCPTPLARSRSLLERVPLREALKVWAYVSINSFGGPAGQIAVMHRVLVDTRHWISERRFLHALNYCMLLPGPEAQQLSVYIGWLMHGSVGGLLAGILFVLPGFLAILALSILYAGYQDTTFVEALFYGLAPAVLAIVAAAVLRVGRRALTDRTLVAIAAAVVRGALLPGGARSRWSSPAAGLFGYAARAPASGWRRPGPAARHEPPAGSAATRRRSSATSTRRAGRPIGEARAPRARARRGPVARTARPPRRAARHAGRVRQPGAVLQRGRRRDVRRGLRGPHVRRPAGRRGVRVAEPDRDARRAGDGRDDAGPARSWSSSSWASLPPTARAGSLDPMLAGLLGAVLVTWVTFVPSFLWVFLGAPYAEHLRGSRRLTGALSAITAAVVGAILNLAVWFALHAIFGVGRRGRRRARSACSSPIPRPSMWRRWSSRSARPSPCSASRCRRWPCSR